MASASAAGPLDSKLMSWQNSKLQFLLSDGFLMFWELVGVDVCCFGSLLGSFFFMFWELVKLISGPGRLCLTSLGPGQLQETNLEAFCIVFVSIEEEFGSH